MVVFSRSYRGSISVRMGLIVAWSGLTEAGFGFEGVRLVW